MRRLALVVAIAALAVLSGCLETRTQAFRCNPDDTCDDGRSCIDGWCVEMNTPFDGSPDPDGDTPDAPLECPADCTRCEGATCVVECDTAMACEAPIACPAGFDCQIACTGGGSCRGGIECTTGGDCAIECSGDGSCEALILCSGGACEVVCSGVNSCENGVDCSAACSCQTDCVGDCNPAHDCRPGNCNNQDGTCKRTGGPCNQCS
jgi:hypothetical protein